MSAATIPAPQSKTVRPLAAQPYLSFEGRCEEALDFYRAAIGAEVTMISRFQDAPPGGGCEGGPMTPPPGNKIMHASMKIGSTELFATDGMCVPGGAQFKGIALSLAMPDEASTEAAFAALAQGGQIQMPLAETFFAKKFGMVADKFGVTWMVIAPKPM